MIKYFTESDLITRFIFKDDNGQISVHLHEQWLPIGKKCFLTPLEGNRKYLTKAEAFLEIL